MLENEKEIVWFVILGTFVFLIVASFLLAYVNVYNRKKFLHIQEKEAMRLELDKQIIKAKVETQEETLDFISKELHDNIGQLLNSAKLLLGIVQRDPTSQKETIGVAEETLGKAINELRILSKSLNKDWIKQFDLIENLQNEINSINYAGSFKIILTHSEHISLHLDKQIIIFRVLQEAIQNTIKHANASRELIDIIEKEDVLLITIQDNGIGFDRKKISNKSGIGILNMENRIRLLDGQIKWSSAESGTKLSITIPITLQTIFYE